MALGSGSRLGPYEIVSPVGAGGMGEVYKAKDTRLDRTVAIKVLPSKHAEDVEMRSRFEREARAISALNHPHICTLHDVGHQEGTDYLVMEYIEGETLAQRLQKGALPTDQVLRFGTEIADALDRAHRQGIVHRDLKPGNVMLTRSGVKLLDFGLAKLHSPAAAVASGTVVAGMPTELSKAEPLTGAGAVLGTFQYMAPEQLEGKDADARTDLFAFGCVLFEMATGRKAFEGKSQASLISAIMTATPPPISSLQPLAPAALDRLVRTCLEKDPDERWQSAHDLMSELKWIAESPAQAGARERSVARSGTRERLAWGLAALALLLAVAAFMRYERRPTGFAATLRSSIVLPEKSALRFIAVSPDGARLAVVARDASGKSHLWIRRLDALAIEPLPGTDNATNPFWSPDGQHIGFFADGKLKKIDVSGGPPQTLCDAPVSRGGSWNRDGVILFAPVTDGPLFRVAASGGPPVQVTNMDPVRGETSHRWPYFLPDGRHFLYLVASFGGPREKTGVYAASLDSKEESFLVRASSSVAYARPGYLLFFQERNLMAQPFDEKGLRVTGDAVPLAEQIQYVPQTYQALFSVSENGLLLYQTRAASNLAQLLWFDRSGRQTGSLGVPGDQANPRISPDGKRVALDINDPQTGNSDVWVYEASGGVATRFTSDPAFDAAPVWSADGTRLVFMSLRANHADLYQKPSSGTRNEEPILQSPATKYATDWSPDGRSLLYRALDPAGKMELWVLPVEGERKPVPFIRTTFGVSHGQFSPDGRWVAYASSESGKWEIYVAPFPGPGGNWKVSSAGGTEPRWRRDGKELFYLAPDGKMMAVTVRPGPAFEAEAEVPLFQTRRREQISSADLYSYDVSPDGQHFLVNSEVGETASAPLNVVLNWTADLKR